MKYRINPHYLSRVLSRRHKHTEKWTTNSKETFHTFFLTKEKKSVLCCFYTTAHIYNKQPITNLHVFPPGNKSNFLSESQFLFTFPQK